MAGYSRIYVVGGQGGFEGADGVNPIEFLVLVGDADREWLEPHYFDTTIEPIGQLRTIIPVKPLDPESLLDACVAFYPRHFTTCPSLKKVESSLWDTTRLDFDASPNDIPGGHLGGRSARPMTSG